MNYFESLFKKEEIPTLNIEYIDNFISIEDEFELCNMIDNQLWNTDMKRRVQHYGYKYDYTKRKIDNSMYLGEIPMWLNPILDKVTPYMNHRPDQIIINEYTPGQGISSHIDCEPCFDNKIVSLSLLSPCVMEFRNSPDRQDILLKPRSIIVLKDEFRYNWTHGIRPRLSDNWNGKIIKRERRVSITFRCVI